MIKAYYIKSNGGTFEMPPFFCKSFTEGIESTSNPALRNMKMLASALLAFALHEAGIKPPYKIQRSEHGKPFLPNEKIKFSYCHTEGLCAAVISDNECGIDAESIKRSASFAEISSRFFTPDEKEYLSYNNYSGEIFYEIWTKKEAYLKFTGKGLAGGLNSFSVLSLDEENMTSFRKENYIISVYGKCRAGIHEVTPADLFLKLGIKL
ncbi:MAG: 4'-phosphopantetheinyl transferase superfamily protein [Spirochaetes bacterium]|nr:4'-phosphopantetheinyl transferase superfamily protein [Spirochaetota bacterium]